MVPCIDKRSLRGAGSRAPPAEIALGLCIFPLCLVSRTGLLTLPAFDAGIGAADPEEALCCTEGEDETVRADQPAERAVEDQRDQEHDQEHDRSRSQGKVEEIIDPKPCQQGCGEDKRHDEENNKKHTPHNHERDLLPRTDFRYRRMVRDLLYSADRAGITAEEPAEDKRQEEHNRKRDNADDEGAAEALHIPQHDLLELVGC